MTTLGLQVENPFPGLRPYDREHSDLFFGRDEQVDELLDRLESRRFVAVVGTSGSGKSSLVRAGLVPAVHRGFIAGAGSTWRTVVMRPGSEPIRELAGPLAAEFRVEETDTHAALDSSWMGLAAFADKNLRAGENLLLVVDQFEEIFRYARTGRLRAGSFWGGSSKAANPNRDTSDEPAAFIKLLLSAVGRSDVPVPGLAHVSVYVVLTMRSDFLGKCAQFHGLPEALNDSQYLVPRMTRDQLLESIEGPIGMSGAHISPRLSQRLLNDCGENPNLLPVLQHSLMRVWEESREARECGEEVDLPHYENPVIGGMSKALSLDAERAYCSVATDDRAKWMVRRVFERLVDPGAQDEETRRPTPLSELTAVCEAPKNEILRLIQPFRERGFLAVSQDEDPVVDISHESLIRLWDRLGRWVKGEVGNASIYKRLADSATRQLALYRDPELTEARRWRELTHPNAAWAERYLGGQAFDESMRFLDRSQWAQKKRIWLKAGAVVALVLLTILVAIVVGLGNHALRVEHAEQARTHKALQQAYREQTQRLAVEQRYAEDQRRNAEEQLKNAEALQTAFERERRMLQETIAAKRGELVEHLTAQAALLRSEKQSNAPLSALLTVNSVNRQPTPENGRMLPDLVSLLPKQTQRLQLQDKVWSVAFSPEGKLMATGSDDGLVQVFNVQTWKAQWRKKFSFAIVFVTFSPSGRQLVEGGGDHTARVLNANTGEQISSFVGSKMVWSAAFSPDERSVALVNGENSVQVFDPATGKQQPGFEASFLTRKVDAPASLDRVAFSPDGRWLIAADTNGRFLYFFDRASGRLVYRPEQSQVRSVAFSPDSHYIAIGRADSTVRVFSVPGETDISEGLPLREVSRFELEGQVSSATFSPSGRLIVAGSDGNAAVVFETLTGRQVSQFLSDGPVTSVAFSPLGDLVAIGSIDKTARVFSTRAGLQMADFTEEGDIHDVEFTSDFEMGVVTSEDGTATIFDGSSGKSLFLLKHQHHVTTAAFSRDKQWLVTGDEAGVISVFRVGNDQPTWQFKEDGQIDDAQFSPDGHYIATGSDDKTLRLLEASTGKEVWRTKLGDRVNEVVFSRNNRSLASAASDGTARVFEVGTGVELQRISSTSNSRQDHPPVSRVAVSSDGRQLAMSAYDNILRVFDLTSKPEKLLLEMPQEALTSDIVYSPDGRYIAISSFDHTVRVIDVRAKNEISRARYPYNVYYVQFSGDERSVLSAGPLEATPRGASKPAYRAWFYKQFFEPSDLVHEACRLLTQNLSPAEWKQYIGSEPYKRICPNLPIPQETATAR